VLLLGGPDQRGGAAGALDGVLVGQKAHIAATTLADLDDNRNLVHASVESSEQANIYSGTATLDENGEATLELPEWMGALNEDFRYQLTCLGQFAPVYIAEEVSENRFKIAGGSSGVRVGRKLTR
jgi:hypothetical protein